jgi:hypothetical protein
MVITTMVASFRSAATPLKYVFSKAILVTASEVGMMRSHEMTIFLGHDCYDLT